MKKTEIVRIEKTIKNSDIKFDTFSMCLYYNNSKLAQNKLKILPIFSELEKYFDSKLIYSKLIEYCQDKNLLIDSNEQKIQAKAAEQQAKAEAKAAEQQAKAEAKAAEQQMKDTNIMQLSQMLYDKYKNLIAVDSNQDIRLKGKKLSVRNIEMLISQIMSEPDFRSLTNNITRGEVKDILFNIASKNKYVIKMNADITFGDIMEEIENEEHCTDENYWESYINTDKNDNIMKSTALYIIYSNTYIDKVHYNINDDGIYIEDDNGNSKLISNKELAALRVNAGMKLGKEISKDNMLSALDLVKKYANYTSHKIRFNPFFDDKMCKHMERCLNKCENGWDGVDRVHTMLQKFFDCEDNIFFRNVMEYMLMQSFRANEDNDDIEISDDNYKKHTSDKAYMFFGAQGAGKTTFITKLFGSYYMPTNLKDMMQMSYNIAGKYCCLWDELKGWQPENATIEEIKQWITSDRLDVTQKYNTFTTHIRKTWVDVGTSNDDTWYNDNEYERRFVTIPLPKSAGKRTEEDWEKMGFDQYYIDQVWTQAALIYREKYEGKSIKFDPEFEELNRKYQIERNKIMGDQEAQEKLEDIIDNIKFYKEEYNIDEKEMFLNEYNAYKNRSDIKTTNENEIMFNDQGMSLKPLKRLDDYLIFKILNNRKQNKVKLILKHLYKWRLEEYKDKYGKNRWRFYRPE